MARYCPLFSGSSGNCTYIGTASGGILIDAGVSARRLEKALRARNIDPASIAAVFVTHEHGDHIAGLEVFAGRYCCAVFGSAGTLGALPQSLSRTVLTPKTDGYETRLAGYDCEGVEAAGMWVTAFETPHDARQSTGYIIRTSDGRRIGVATDIGQITDLIRSELRGCDLVHIESNHDLPLLNAGPYPYFLKKRILADTGHLSNSACARELENFAKTGTARFVLSHLSRENNTPELAYAAASSAMKAAGLTERLDYQLWVAAPEDRTGVIVF
ncbi:MAG: MBL fold metallo-hydrolase [Oscillospiraceae bacterium]|nr:MBL fold metallo-hydrolase [Oscillospiraceae bacterium]